MTLISEIITVSIDKDWFTFLTFIVSAFILGVTALAVWRAPLKAVEIGRKLSDKQKKDEDKRNLFLTLFALRGTPVTYDFVMGLNKIEIVFYGCSSVIESWRALRLELQKRDSEEQRKISMGKTHNLLRNMAENLNYQGVNATLDGYHYYPEGFEYLATVDRSLKHAELDYYKKSIEFYALMTDVYQESLSKKSEPENS